MDLTITDRPKFEGQAGDRPSHPERPGVAASQACTPSMAGGQQKIDRALADDDALRPARYAPRSFHWKTFSIVAGIHVAAASALLGLGVVDIPRAQNKRLTVVDIRIPTPKAELPPRPQPEVVPETVTQDPTPAAIKPRIELSSKPSTAMKPPLPQPAAPAHVDASPAPPAPPAPVTPPDFSAAQLNNPGPRYPYASRRNREEGTVMLKVLVTPDGLAGEVKINQSSGFERLDAAAIQTIRKWRFVPARQAGKAIAAWVLVPIDFYLS